MLFFIYIQINEMDIYMKLSQVNYLKTQLKELPENLELIDQIRIIAEKTGIQLDSVYQEMEMDDVIALEEKEYEDILKELDDLVLLDDDSITWDKLKLKNVKVEKVSN